MIFMKFSSWLSLLATLLCAAPSGWAAPAWQADTGAGQERGLNLARQARAALLEGDTAGAETLLEQARVEWPNSHLLANLSGDVMVAADSWSRAVTDYNEGLGSEDEALTHHALFNRAVTESTAAEVELAEAGVPLDPAALPEQGSPPGLLPAIESNLPRLRRSRNDFLSAHDLVSDVATRHSVASINRRLDDLQEMLDELRRQQEEEQQDDQEGEDGEDQEDGEDGEKGEDGEDGQEGDQSQGDSENSGEDGQDPQEEDPEDEDEPGQESEPEEAPQPPGGEEAEPEPLPEGKLTDLTPEEMQRLIEQLEQLERRARQLEKARQAKARRTAEKDW